MGVGTISNGRTLGSRFPLHTNYYKVFHYFRWSYVALRGRYGEITRRLLRPYSRLTVGHYRIDVDAFQANGTRYVAMKRRSM